MKTAMRLALHFATTTINRVARFRETRFGLSALFFLFSTIGSLFLPLVHTYTQERVNTRIYEREITNRCNFGFSRTQRKAVSSSYSSENMEIWKPNDSGGTRSILLTYAILKSELSRNYIDFSPCAKCTTLSRANIALIQCDGDFFGEQSWERFFFSRAKYFHSSIVCGINEITIRKKLYRIFY